MTSMVLGKRLGKLEPIDLRTFWADEARDFTPWLATVENLDVLSSTLGFDLEREGVEVPVGPYKADIVARDLTSGNRVKHGQDGRLARACDGSESSTNALSNLGLVPCQGNILQIDLITLLDACRHIFVDEAQHLREKLMPVRILVEIFDDPGSDGELGGLEAVHQMIVLPVLLH